MEELKGKIKFYDDEADILFPIDFKKFKERLAAILGLSEDMISNVKLSYKDEDGDKIEMKIEEDYTLFIEEAKKKKELLVMLVEIKEESNIDIKQCSSSIFAYVAKNSGNINNLSEEIKKKSLELSDEIIADNNSNINNVKENNNINNDINSNKNPNKVIYNNNINQNINNQNNINNINNINSNNNINNNSNINNYINSINNINNSQRQQSIQRPQVPNNAANNNLCILSFPYQCNLCLRGPMYNAIYVCRECNLFICQNCELREGPRHMHPLLKVQNHSQFAFLLGGNISDLEKIVNGVGNTIEGAVDSMMGFFGAKNNNNNKNNKSSYNNKGPQWVSLVQLARSYYDLRNFTDQQIEDALLKSNKNIDQAVILLVSQ